MDETMGKKALKEEIKRVQGELKAALVHSPAPDEALDWRVEFAEVFDRGGFDVVLANPPYIQLQKDGGNLGRLYRDVEYATFVRTGDVYQLFYERGCQLLRSSHGLLAYITSNSWLKAEYGKPLRKYFAKKHEPLTLVELGKDVFASAVVDTSVLLLRKGGTNGAFPAVDVDHLPNSHFPPEGSLWGRVRPAGEVPWSILSSLEESVMDKVQAEGTPLREWDIRINRGILTGYNKAFIIDDATRRALVDEDPRSDDIIKPVLRGKDIQRYRAKWAGRWLIAAHNGYGGIPAIDIDEYPAVKTYLDWFYPQLEKRQDKGKTPYNLRNCVYYEEFSKEKLFWIELVNSGRFAYDDSGIYGEATTFVMTGEGLKYLCAVLNSTLIRWFLEQVAPTSGMGTLRWKKVYVQTIPIPEISATKQRPFIELVNEILEAKAADSGADTSYLEWDIDRLVYDLYGLTEEEDTAIERRLRLIHQTDEEEDAAIAKSIEEALTDERVSREEVMAILRDPDGG